MADRETMIPFGPVRPGRERTVSFDVATDIEALRIAREGVQIAREQGRSVTDEVHDGEGRPMFSYSGAGA